MKRIMILAPFVLLLLFSACATGEENTKNGTEFLIYFLTPSGSAPGSDALKGSTELLSVSETAPTEEKARAVVERLILGSQSSELLSPFPAGTELNSLVVRNTRAYVDLTGIIRLDGIELTLADYCLTLSLSAIEGIDSVYLSCNGRILPQQPRQIFQQQDVLLSTEDSVLQRMDVLLYFPDDNNVLTAEKRTLDVYEGESQSAVLITALLAGPKDSGLMRIIPESFAISSVKVENGICRINIPASSLMSLPSDENTQHLILWSLAESLYSLEHIQEIRLMTEGKELEYFGSVAVSSITTRPQG